MNDAMEDAGIQEFKSILYEDEMDEALQSIDQEIGPDVAIKEMQKNIAFYNPTSRRKKRRGRKPILSKLPDHLRALLQQANMKYIDGENEAALSLIQEIIRQKPDSSEAWLSMAMIYKHINDEEKNLHCELMAAFFSPCSDLWKSLGKKALELDHRDQALYCLKRAGISKR